MHLGLRIRNIEIMECNVLNNLLLLVHIALWKGHILLCLINGCQFLCNNKKKKKRKRKRKKKKKKKKKN